MELTKKGTETFSSECQYTATLGPIFIPPPPPPKIFLNFLSFKYKIQKIKPFGAKPLEAEAASVNYKVVSFLLSVAKDLANR